MFIRESFRTLTKNLIKLKNFLNKELLMIAQKELKYIRKEVLPFLNKINLKKLLNNMKKVWLKTKFNQSKRS